jgi:1-deoxy-D-xylulose-5-phosphate reductoisomerase
MKKVAILGSTGSIGINTLKVIEKFRDKFKVVGLSAKENITELEKQIEEFSPSYVSIMDDEKYYSLKSRLGSEVQVYNGIEGIIKIVKSDDVDIVVSAIVGSAGMLPTLEAVKSGKTVALANKESLVMAGELIMQEAKNNNATIIPIDSEHNAIFQCIGSHKKEEIKKIILTASGGPFLHRANIKNVTVQEALQHPTWSMGKKITIDSATLMNKGFEVIEAFFLFGIPLSNIEVVIHPQSVVHSFVEYIDGSVMAKLGVPDMRIPIQYAINYPQRMNGGMPKLDLTEISKLTFSKPDFERFPCLKYAYEALEKGGTMPAVLNSTNEIAVKNFLNGRIKFHEIPEIIKQVMEKHTIKNANVLENIFEADMWAKDTTNKLLSR